MPKKPSPFKRVVRFAWVEHRALTLALIFAVAGLVMLVIAFTVSGVLSYDTLLTQLTSRGVSAATAVAELDQLRGGSFASNLLVAVGGSCLAIGVISIGWEVVVNTAWLRLVREEIIHALTKPGLVTSISRRSDLLASLLVSFHGKELGRAMLRESETMLEKAPDLRQDFTYNIRLSERDASYVAATFYIAFTLPRLPKRSCISFVQLRDSLEFHERYQQLLASDPSSIYRYILLSDQIGAPQELFLVESATVESTRRSPNISTSLVAVERSSDAGHHILELRSDDADRSLLREISHAECRVTLRISTVVDARRSEFPILFGYPVKTFRSMMDASGLGAVSVDVLEFFTSPKRFRREDGTSGAESPNVVTGLLDDVILPDSGLTYIWRTTR